MDIPNEFYDLRCPDCGYTTWVKGGEGAVMAGATVTIVCSTCRELYDALISRGILAIYVEPHCPNGDDHPVALWTFPGPCPKCGAQMRKTGAVRLID
jgi:predicted nucleic-acid-binding Zn-ribbon protein